MKKSNENSKGVLIITWKNVSDERIKDIVSGIYSENRDAIENMAYREYIPEMAEKVSQIYDFVEGKKK